ncbi:MAG: murein hydrolase activator EnvC family protein [Acutalibacteraceae bacterium]
MSFRKRKLLCLLVSFIMLFSAVCMPAGAQTQSELEDKIDQIDAEIAAYEQKLAQMQSDATKQKEYLETLESQIDSVEAKANELQSQIDELNGQINELTAEYNVLKAKIDTKNKNIQKANVLIEQTEAYIDKSSDLLATKLRQSYMQGEESTIKILMGADSLASFLNRLEMLKRSSESSKKTIDEFKQKATTLKKTKAQLEEDKKILAESQAKIVETRNTYTKKKAVLVENQSEFQATVKTIETKYAQVESYIASLDQSSTIVTDRIAQLAQQRAEADAQIDKILEEYYSQQLPSDNNEGDGYEGDYSGGSSSSSGSNESYTTTDTWAWPVGDRDYYITSEFGYRDSVLGTNSNHTAIDISGSGFYGTSIYAARAGTVIFSGDDGYGYGNYVLIDHGDGYVTQYAHNSQNLVSSGDTVTKGQCIAYAGSTGISTGPHLHFAIKYNGEPVDPANFYSY